MMMAEVANIRSGNQGDAEAINELYNHFVRETAVTFDLEPTTLEQRQTWLKQFDEKGAHQIFIAEIRGKLAGYAASFEFRKKPAYFTSVETSIYVDPNRQRSGLAYQLYSELLKSIEKHGVHRAYAGITLPNEASVALHQKVGFQHVGTFREVGLKFERYWDVGWFEAAIG
jgi:phosphinothricin acetyltransferase